MAAVWMRARSEIRSRLPGLLGLILITGIGGGVTIAAVAGARRSDSAYPRFEKETRAYDASVSAVDNGLSYDRQHAILERASQLPSVIDSAFVSSFNGTLETSSGKTFSYPDVFLISDDQGKIGRTIETVKVVRGRMFDPSKDDEAITNPSVARQLGLGVGDMVTLHVTDAGGRVRDARVRVVGEIIAAGQVDSSYGGFIPLFFVTRAFLQAHTATGEAANPSILIRLRGGTAGLSEFDAEAARAKVPVGPVSGQGDESQGPQAKGLARSTLFVAVGFRLFAGLVALAVLSVVAQLLGRQLFLDSSEYRALFALGMTRSQLAMLSMIRASVVAAGAAILAIVVAFLASPLAPYGPTHLLELHPGFQADWLVFAIGAGAVIGSVFIASLVPTIRIAATASRPESEAQKGSRSDAFAQSSLPVTMANGIRMALQPGRGSTAVPVRTAIFGTATAIAALAAAMCFGGSLHRLATTPSLAGWNWDAIAGGFDANPAIADQLRSTGLASSVDRGWLGLVRVGSIQQFGLAFDDSPRGPVIVAGRAPARAGEIALGVTTLHALKASIGSSVPVSFESILSSPSGPDPANAKPVTLRVVGTFAPPQTIYSFLGGGTGAVVSMDELRAVSLSLAMDDALFVRFAHDVSLTTGTERLKEVVGPIALVFQRAQATDQSNLRRVSGVPTVLGILLALLAAATLVHTLVSSVRRRRRDLAILKTIGFTPAQIGSTVAWQATTLVVIAVAVGLPLGTIAGRLGWAAFAQHIGFASQPVVPLIPVLVAIPAAIALGNSIAGLPARAAARTRASEVLHAE